MNRNSEGYAMKLTVNGQKRVLEGVDPTMPLLWAIRDLLGLKGTKFGCGQALCGASLTEGLPPFTSEPTPSHRL